MIRIIYMEHASIFLKKSLESKLFLDMWIKSLDRGQKLIIRVWPKSNKIETEILENGQSIYRFYR